MMFDVVVERLGEDGGFRRFEDRVAAPSRTKLVEQLVSSRYFVDESPRVYSPEFVTRLEAEGIVREIRNAGV